MTVSQMIESLRLVEADGNGHLEVLIQDPDDKYGCGTTGDYQIGHVDVEGYVWHPIDVQDAINLEGYNLSEQPDVIMFM